MKSVNFTERLTVRIDREEIRAKTSIGIHRPIFAKTAAGAASGKVPISPDGFPRCGVKDNNSAIFAEVISPPYICNFRNGWRLCSWIIDSRNIYPLRVMVRIQPNNFCILSIQIFRIFKVMKLNFFCWFRSRIFFGCTCRCCLTLRRGFAGIVFRNRGNGQLLWCGLADTAFSRQRIRRKRPGY